MEKSQTLYKRILVKLSGEALMGDLEYGIEPSVIKRIADELIQVDGGNLVIDHSSVMFLFGTEIDYVNEVFGSQFEIRNPNTKSACGCGESIQFDMDKVNG